MAEPAFQTQGYWTNPHTTAGVAGTERVHLGIANERGLTIRQFTVVPVAALARSGSAYYTFKPFIVTVKDGTPSLRYFGTSRGTNTYTLLADVPLRIHDEEFLNEKLPVGALVGVDIVTTSTPTSARLYFQAGFINHGR